MVSSWAGNTPRGRGGPFLIQCEALPRKWILLPAGMTHALVAFPEEGHEPICPPFDFMLMIPSCRKGDGACGKLCPRERADIPHYPAITMR